jgi:arsenite-transporting ATPase
MVGDVAVRVVMVCGKGGVGKSTLAAAMALRASQAGIRTHLLSADPAHSLSILLQNPHQAMIWQVNPCLQVQELAGYRAFREDFPETIAWAQGILSQEGTSHAFGAELSLLPGVEELWMLRQLQRRIESADAQLVIVDQAPTAFALRILSLPVFGAWYAKHASRVQDRLTGQLMVLMPMLLAQGAQLPGGVLAELRLAIEAMKRLPEWLINPAVTTTTLVTTPDPLAEAEARLLFSTLSLYGITCERLVLNQVSEATEAQALQARFAPLAFHSLARMTQTPWEKSALTALGEQIPLAWFEAYQGDGAFSVQAEGGCFTVSQQMPFVKPQEVELAKMGNELYITLGEHRRTVLLPDEAASLQTKRAKFSEGRLTVSLA